MLQRINSSPMKSSHPFLATALVAAALAAFGPAAQAQQDVFGADVQLDSLGGEQVDPTVYATLMPNDDVVERALVQSAIAAAMAAPGSKPKTIVPITAVVNKAALRPVR